MGQPWPLDIPAAYDTLVLGSRTWPGVARVKVSRKQKLDKKAGKGTSGAKITFQGAEPAEVSIDVIVWDSATKDDMEAALAELEPEAGKKDPTPFDINHPIAVIRKVKAIVLESLSGPEWDDDKKWWKIQIKAVDWTNQPATNGTSTPSSAVAAGSQDAQGVNSAMTDWTNNAYAAWKAGQVIPPLGAPAGNNGAGAESAPPNNTGPGT